MNKLMLIGLITVSCLGSAYIIHDDAQHKKDIYALLEKEEMTEDEMDRVNLATDPDFAKESYVVLDDKHAELFKKHFGHCR